MVYEPKGITMEHGLPAEIDINRYRHWKVVDGNGITVDTYPTHDAAMMNRPALHSLAAESDAEVRARLAQQD